MKNLGNCVVCGGRGPEYEECRARKLQEVATNTTFTEGPTNLRDIANAVRLAVLVARAPNGCKVAANLDQAAQE